MSQWKSLSYSVFFSVFRRNIEGEDKIDTQKASHVITDMTLSPIESADCVLTPVTKALQRTETAVSLCATGPN